MDEQEVRQVCSILHETCTLIVQLFETNIFEDQGAQSRLGSAESEIRLYHSQVWGLGRIWIRHFPAEIERPNPQKCSSQKVGLSKCKSRAGWSKSVGLLVRPPAACEAMARRRNGPVETVKPVEFTGKTDPTGSFFLKPIRTLISLSNRTGEVLIRNSEWLKAPPRGVSS